MATLGKIFFGLLLTVIGLSVGLLRAPAPGSPSVDLGTVARGNSFIPNGVIGRRVRELIKLS